MSLVQGSFSVLNALNPYLVPEPHPLKPVPSPHILYVALLNIFLRRKYYQYLILSDLTIFKNIKLQIKIFLNNKKI